MHVSSAGPLSVASIVWQPRPGAFALTVICKATFTLQPGESPLAPAQEPPYLADALWDGGASLRAASDRVPFKRRVDVLVGGSAHAPGEQPVASLVARLAVGPLLKTIEVHGDRVWMLNGALSAASPFTRMPLRWERAAGGKGTVNPVGVPIGAPPDARGYRPAPNLFPVGFKLRNLVQVIPPAGFGPIAPTWPERTGKLGRHAATWHDDTWVAEPLPDDVDVAFFNAAPADQQIDQLGPGQPLVLDHLHPEHAHLRTRLAPWAPKATLQRRGGAQPITLRCDTLWIDTDLGTGSLVWRGAVPLQHPREEGLVLVTMQQVSLGEEPAPIELPPIPAPVLPAATAVARKPASPASIDETAALSPSMVLRAAEPLPFRPELSPEKYRQIKAEILALLDRHGVDEAAYRAAELRHDPGAKSAPAAQKAELDDAEPVTPRKLPPRSEDDLRGTGMIDWDQVQSGAALPFGAASSPEEGPSGTGMIDWDQVQSGAALPFGAASPADDGEGGWASLTLTASNAPVAKLAVLPFGPPGASPPPLPPSPSPRGRRQDDWSVQTLAADEAPAARLPATPFEAPPAPRIAPIAPIAPSPPLAPIAPIAPSASPSPLPLPELLALDRYAAIQAELWERPGTSLGELLGGHGLTEVEWLAHEARYREAIEIEAREGRAALASRASRALVAARRARRPAGEPSLRMEDYRTLRGELESAADPQTILARHGLTLAEFRRLERRIKRGTGALIAPS